MILKVKCFQATWCKWKLVIATKAEGISSWRRLPSHIYAQNCRPFLKHLSAAVTELNDGLRSPASGVSFTSLRWLNKLTTNRRSFVFSAPSVPIQSQNHLTLGSLWAFTCFSTMNSFAQLPVPDSQVGKLADNIILAARQITYSHLWVEFGNHQESYHRILSEWRFDSNGLHQIQGRYILASKGASVARLTGDNEVSLVVWNLDVGDGPGVGNRDGGWGVRAVEWDCDIFANINNSLVH